MRNFDLFKELDEMREQLDELDNKRKQEIVETAAVFLFSASILTILAFARTSGVYDLDFILNALINFFVAGMFSWGARSMLQWIRKENSYEKRFEKEIIQPILLKAFPEAKHYDEKYFPPPLVEASGLFPEKYDGITGQDYMHCKSEGLSFEFSEIKPYKIKYTRDSDGHKRREEKTVFKAVMGRVSGKFNFNADFAIFTTPSTSFFGKKLGKEKLSFNEPWLVDFGPNAQNWMKKFRFTGDMAQLAKEDGRQLLIIILEAMQNSKMKDIRVSFVKGHFFFGLKGKEFLPIPILRSTHDAKLFRRWKIQLDLVRHMIYQISKNSLDKRSA